MGPKSRHDVLLKLSEYTASLEVPMNAVRIRTAALCVTIVMTTAASLSGQTVVPVTRFDVGMSFLQSRPRADFRQNVGNGIGGAGSLLCHIDRSGWLSLRVDGSGI